jgi:hypothetical protein
MLLMSSHTHRCKMSSPPPRPPPVPAGFEQAVAAENATPRGRANGGTMLAAQPTERSLLTCLLARLQTLDADVLVGHNIGAGDLTTLLYRMQHHKVRLVCMSMHTTSTTRGGACMHTKWGACMHANTTLLYCT